jgi:hypothetical protein
MDRIKGVPFEMEFRGRIVTAYYVVEDGCVRARHNGGWTNWTQVGGSAPVSIARMLLWEMLEGKAA